MVLCICGIPHRDLCATGLNRKCHLFCSRADHFLGSLIHACLFPWKEKLLYYSTPIPQLPMVLYKFKQDHAHMIFIERTWLCQHWFSTFLWKLCQFSISCFLGSQHNFTEPRSDAISQPIHTPSHSIDCSMVNTSKRWGVLWMYKAGSYLQVLLPIVMGVFLPMSTAERFFTSLGLNPACFRLFS